MRETRYAPGVVLADDDVLLCEGLASLLDHSGFEVVGQAGNGTELLALMAEKHVRSILTKLDLPESDAEHRRVLAVLRFLDAR
jgi:DNA-binding NarL/FixJ family response regulator